MNELESIDKVILRSQLNHLNLQRDVRKFHEEKLPYLIQPPVPTIPNAEIALEMITSIGQEYQELKEAATTKDLEKWADAIVDTIYTLIGAAVESGIDIDPLWVEVQRANMSKFPAAAGTNGRKTITGESTKPADFIKPRIAELLRRQGAEI